MSSDQSYKTAYGAAYARLIEQYVPEEEKLFEDNVIGIFFSRNINIMLKFNWIRRLYMLSYNAVSPGVYGLQVCRTKFIDDRLNEAINTGITQIVILGAGLDTRGYRINYPKETKIYEVDLPVLQNKKMEIIKKHFGTMPSNIEYVPIDFNTQYLGEVLSEKNFDFCKPSFFIWEGVTQYIPEDAVRRTLEFIAEAPGGSQIIFTYVLRSVIEKKSLIGGSEFLMTSMEAGDHGWKFGISPDEVREFIRPYGLELVKSGEPEYFERVYLKPLGRSLEVSDIEHIAFCRRCD
jgi:methyltransferase (TIGR00027 family)